MYGIMGPILEACGHYACVYRSQYCGILLLLFDFTCSYAAFCDLLQLVRQLLAEVSLLMQL